MNKLLLSSQQLERILLIGKGLYPKSVGTHTTTLGTFDNWDYEYIKLIDDYCITVYSDGGTQRMHWLEFCLCNIIPKLKDCCGLKLKEFMINLIANFHLEARCLHPVDWLYELYLKQI